MLRYAPTHSTPAALAADFSLMALTSSTRAADPGMIFASVHNFACRGEVNMVVDGCEA
jgi:hypothetical protein